MTDTTDEDGFGRIGRRQLLAAFAATMVTAAPTYSKAAGFLRRGGNYRRLKMVNGRTGESMDLIYWVDGKYIRDAVREVSVFMRDWRENKAIAIDTRTMDIMSAAHGVLGTSEPYLLLSGYRTPRTNAMLRSKSSGVARNSLHMQGKAADLRLKSRSVNQMYRAAASFHAGGVGRYSGSNFVHMDSGQVRTWGA